MSFSPRAYQFSGHRGAVTEVAVQLLPASSSSGGVAPSDGTSEGALQTIASAAVATGVPATRVSSRYRVATASHDGTVRVWAQESAASLRTVACFCGFFKDVPEYLRFGRLGDSSSCMLYVTSSNALYALDVSSAALIQRTPTLHREYECADIDSMAISSDGATIALGDDDGAVLLVNSSTLDCTRVIAAVHSNLIGSLYFGPDASILYSGGFDSLMVQFDVARGRSKAALDFGRLCPGSTNPAFVHCIDGVAVASGERSGDVHEELVACALGNGEVKLIRTSDFSIRGSVEASGAMISYITMSVSGLLIASSNSGKILVYAIEAEEDDAADGAKMSASEKRRLRRGGKKQVRLPNAYALREVWRNEAVDEYKINSIAAIDLGYDAEASSSSEEVLSGGAEDDAPRRHRRVRIFVATTCRDLLCFDICI